MSKPGPPSIRLLPGPLIITWPSRASSLADAAPKAMPIPANTTHAHRISDFCISVSMMTSCARLRLRPPLHPAKRAQDYDIRQPLNSVLRRSALLMKPAVTNRGPRRGPPAQLPNRLLKSASGHHAGDLIVPLDHRAWRHPHFRDDRAYGLA